MLFYLSTYFIFCVVQSVLQELSISKPSQLTPKAKKLYNLLRKQRNSSDTLRERVRMEKKKKPWLDVNWLMERGVNRLTAEFIKLQLEQQMRKTRGRRFNHEIKLLGIALFKRSPAQYKIFNKIFCMPKRQTLNNVSVNFKFSFLNLYNTHLQYVLLILDRFCTKFH